MAITGRHLVDRIVVRSTGIVYLRRAVAVTYGVTPLRYVTERIGLIALPDDEALLFAWGKDGGVEQGAQGKAIGYPRLMHIEHIADPQRRCLWDSMGILCHAPLVAHSVDGAL